MTHRTLADYYAGIPQYPGRITPAELVAAQAAAWDACIRAIEETVGNGDDPLAYVYANNPYRASNVEGMNQ